MTEQRKTKEQMAEEYCEKFVNEYGLYGQMSNPPLRSAAEGFRIGFFAGYSAALSELEQRERETNVWWADRFEVIAKLLWNRKLDEVEYRAAREMSLMACCYQKSRGEG